ncbi:MAG: hypothetical protein HN855_03805 [Anaerolineae bacterium]|nr:hypothetical protein [Anaerolineae bacterium]MBT7070891.1 hypothetical protein [Anaerolineae bacterium]MBT7324258.1 hypothetical protein [Anaerolineae bacterium]
MPQNFHTRLRNYYLKVAEVLRGEANAASVFPNATDIGVSRERIYANFLQQHAPSKCNVFLGGFLFHMNGTESKQLDVIVTTDTAPQFNFHNRDGGGKSFSPVEGTLGVASIKSFLDKAQLHDALDGIASIPNTETLEKRASFTIKIKDYDDWPYKIIYASNGLSAKTILSHLNDYYKINPQIQENRRPNVIHVVGKYAIFRAIQGMSIYDQATGQDIPLEPNSFHIFTANPDLQAIVWVLNALQQNATASTHILFNYGDLINRINHIPDKS